MANRVQWEGTPRRVVATSKTFKQLARLNGAPRGREGPFVRRTISRSQVAQSIRQLMAVLAAQDGRSFGESSRLGRGRILGGAVVAYETMRCLRIEQAEVSPWALREGIVLEHLAALRGAGERLTLQPLMFNGSVGSATITTLPDRTADRG